MDLQIKHDIDNNVFSTSITIAGLGTEVFSEDEEMEMLKNFPSKVSYRNLDFTKNIIMNGVVPEVTDKNSSDSVVAVTLPPLSNKEILLNKDFLAEYKIDINKIPNSAVDKNVLTTKELVAYAYCAVYDRVICDAVTEIMENLRSKAPAFEGETIINI